MEDKDKFLKELADLLGRKYKKAEHLIDIGKYELAEKMLHEILKKEPDDSEAHNLLAFNYFRWGRIKSALKEAEESIRLSPTDASSHFTLALIYGDGINSKRAEEEFKKAIELNPNSSLLFGGYAEFLAFEKRFNEAEEFAEKALSIDPNEPTAINALGTIGINKKSKLAASKESLGSLLKQNPTDYAVLNNMGLVELDLGNYEKAIQCFNDALRMNPEYDISKYNLMLAIKARNIFYRPLYHWGKFAHSNKFGPFTRFVPNIVFVIIFFSSLMLKSYVLAALSLFIFMLFVIYTWTIDPIFNFLIKKKIIKVD